MKHLILASCSRGCSSCIEGGPSGSRSARTGNRGADLAAQILSSQSTNQRSFSRGSARVGFVGRANLASLACAWADRRNHVPVVAPEIIIGGIERTLCPVHTGSYAT